jgi:hypothetical protein
MACSAHLRSLLYAYQLHTRLRKRPDTVGEPPVPQLCLAYAIVEGTGIWRIQRSNSICIAVEIGSPTVSARLVT